VRAWKDQNTYSREIQIVIYAVNNALIGGQVDVHIYNAGVVSMAREWGLKDWRKCPQPELARNLKKVISRKEDSGTNINFIKVKEHTSIRGNEKADKRTKDSTKMEITYFNEKDIQEFQNKAILKKGNKMIRENYKKEIV
jgi:hypothetical protein